MTYGMLFNLIILASISALLASAMVHAADPPAPPSEEIHHRTGPAPAPAKATTDNAASGAHTHHSHGGHGSHHAATTAPAASALTGWAEFLKLDGAKASALNAAEANYHEQRRALKKKHYAEMIALEKDKLKSLETVLSRDELAKLQKLWIEQLQQEHQQH